MVGTKCLVLFCRSQGTIPGIRYFSLTTARHDSWLTALGRNPNIERLSCENRICSLHFAEEDIINKKNRATVRPGAIPTRHLGIRRPITSLQDRSASTDLTDSESSSFDFQNIIEEEVIFSHLEVALNDEENQESPNSPTASSETLSADSTGEEFDTERIIMIIFVLLGIFVLPSVNIDTGSSRIRELKRKLEEIIDSSSDSNGSDIGIIKKAKGNKLWE